MAVIKARFLNRMAACVKEDKTVSGASRILLVKAKRAYDLLADGQRWEDFEEERKIRIEEGTLAKLRYSNGFYEGSILPPDEPPADPDEDAPKMTGRPLRQGKGVCLMSSGEIYEGDYWNDHRHGTGLCFWGNGDLCLGSWVKDKSHGFGLYYFSHGGSYVGEFAAGKIHGAGLHTWVDGS
ncbi:unnamed protein product, partial [Polarella glacialis]